MAKDAENIDYSHNEEFGLCLYMLPSFYKIRQFAKWLANLQNDYDGSQFEDWLLISQIDARLRQF